MGFRFRLHSYCRPRWPRVLRRRSAAARLLRLWVRIPLRHGCLSVVSVVCCQVEVSETSWSLIQRSHTDCAVSFVWFRNLANEEARAHWGLSRLKKKLHSCSCNIACWWRVLVAENSYQIINSCKRVSCVWLKTWFYIFNVNYLKGITDLSKTTLHKIHLDI